MHRQIRIQSDGIGAYTVVTTSSGEKLAPIDATVFLAANERNRVDLTFVDLDCDIHADLQETIMTCPVCNHQQSHHCPPESL